MTTSSQRHVEHLRASVRAVDVIVVGAGHSGLAMSHALSMRGIDHLVLERGQVAQAWEGRWDSLRLLTPNWQTRLPSFAYDGNDPDGFMTKGEVAAFIRQYARRVACPVLTGTQVLSVQREAGGYRVKSDRGEFRCRALVLASGAYGLAKPPPCSSSLAPGIQSLTAHAYRNPEQVEGAHVLVVGASATGLQLADELLTAGRRVTLAVGEHVRMPRRYRGLDVQRWLDAVGVLDERYDEVDDIVRARRVPSPQLSGASRTRSLELNSLTDRGARLVGPLVGLQGSSTQFSGSLRNHCTMADLKLKRLLNRFDTWADERGLSHRLDSPERVAPTQVDASPLLGLDLEREGIRSVLWATGFRADYSWLHVPVVDARGRLHHHGGVVDAPGLYALGLNFMRRRKSSFIHGAEDDVRELSAHLEQHLERTSARVRTG